MDCCSAFGCDEVFDEDAARQDADRYRRQGLDPLGRRAVAEIGASGTVLEVGGGVGALQIELLRAGAGSVTAIELSAAYERFAEELLVEEGLAGRVERRVGDLAREGDAVPEAAAVVLHRVVCCYPDSDGLVAAAARKARRLLVLTYPRHAWWMRIAIRAENLRHRLRGRSFRAYVHAPAALEAAARRGGLTPKLEDGGLRWRIAVFERRRRPAAAAS